MTDPVGKVEDLARDMKVAGAIGRLGRGMPPEAVERMLDAVTGKLPPIASFVEGWRAGALSIADSLRVAAESVEHPGAKAMLLAMAEGVVNQMKEIQ
jgi:hypothetical protein